MRSRDAMAAALSASLLTAVYASNLHVSSFSAEHFAAVGSLAVASTPGQVVSVFSMPDGQVLDVYSAVGPVLGVAAGQEGAAWLTKTEKGPELTVRDRQGNVTSSPIPQDIPADRVAWMGRYVAVLDDQGGELWDPNAKRWVAPELAMSPEAAALFDDSYIEAASNGLVAFIKPFRLVTMPEGRRTLSSVTMFHNLGSSWRELGTAVTTAPRYQKISNPKFDGQSRYLDASFQMSSTRIALDNLGFVALEDKIVLRVPFLQGVWTPDRRPVLGPTPGWSEQIASAGNRLIRLSNNRLISQDLSTGDLATYLPWNLKGTITGLETDGTDAWALTTEGPRLVERGSAEPGGLNGLLRTRMDPGPLNPAQQRLMAELEKWIGVPYVLGGNTKQGVDCSGLVVQTYLSLGIALPRTSATLRTTTQGQIVTDELQVGDVICVPGHVAVYAGGGQTIEAVKGGVRKLNIWRFKDVVVRRFLREDMALPPLPKPKPTTTPKPKAKK